MSDMQLTMLWYRTAEIECLVNSDHDMQQGTWHKFRIVNLLQEISEMSYSEEEEDNKQEFEEFIKLYDHLTKLAKRIQEAEVEHINNGHIVNHTSRK